VKDRAALQSTVEEFLGEYNADSKQPMPLVMFEDAVAHVCRVSRVLRQPQGNALLLGVGGSGRQSLTRLACFMADFELCQVRLLPFVLCVQHALMLLRTALTLQQCRLHHGLRLIGSLTCRTLSRASGVVSHVQLIKGDSCNASH
jgi:P-loop containing dynein motor region D4